MIVRIHKVHWAKEYNSTEKDIDLEVMDVNAYVEKVNHKCAKWAIGEAWCRVSSWFESKHAIVTLGEPKEIENKD